MSVYLKYSLSSIKTLSAIAFELLSKTLSKCKLEDIVECDILKYLTKLLNTEDENVFSDVIVMFKNLSSFTELIPILLNNPSFKLFLTKLNTSKVNDTVNILKYYENLCQNDKCKKILDKENFYKTLERILNSELAVKAVCDCMSNYYTNHINKNIVNNELGKRLVEMLNKYLNNVTILLSVLRCISVITSSIYIIILYFLFFIVIIIVFLFYFFVFFSCFCFYFIIF